MRFAIRGALAAMALAVGTTTSAAETCDRVCLEAIADQYRAAYLAHDTSKAPFAERVRYTENNVEMPFPDGTWDTVTEIPGPVLTLSDPQTGQAAIFTPIRQRATSRASNTIPPWTVSSPKPDGSPASSWRPMPTAISIRCSRTTAKFAAPASTIAPRGART